MVDTPKKSWFGLITSKVLAQAGPGTLGVDSRAADELAGDGRNKINLLAPSSTLDVYAAAEEQSNVHRGR